MLTDYYGTSAVTCTQCGANGVVEFEETTTNTDDDGSWMSWVWSPVPVDASQPDARSAEVTPSPEANL